MLEAFYIKINFFVKIECILLNTRDTTFVLSWSSMKTLINNSFEIDS